MTVAAWTASTAKSAGALVRPTVASGNGLVFRTIAAGTTGSTEPIWPTTFGGIVTDGTITWRAVSQVTGEFQSLEPSSIIELFELQLNTLQHGSNDIYRFHAGANANNNGEVVWNGNAYMRMPVEAEGFEYGGQGQLPRPKIRVSNVLGTITAIILTLPSGLERAKITRIRTLARYLDNANFPSGNPFGTPDPTAEFPREVYYVDRKTTENRDVIEFELAAAFDLQGVRAPKRQCIANLCQWVYRSAECGYTEPVYFNSNDEVVSDPAQDVCGKRLSSCEARFNTFTRSGSVTFGSSALNVNTTGLYGGMPVRGFGIPVGATIASVNSPASATLSAAATASTSTSLTGTASYLGTLSMTSVTGLAPGHSVSGLYVPAGASIVGITGTTVTLNQRPYLHYRSGVFTIYIYFNSIQSYISIDTSDLSVGMRVWGGNGIDTTISSIGSGLIELNNYGALNSSGTPVSLYFLPASPSAQSYSFTESPAITFRSADAALPFGGFPGIGTYFT